MAGAATMAAGAGFSFFNGKKDWKVVFGEGGLAKCFSVPINTLIAKRNTLLLWLMFPLPAEIILLGQILVCEAPRSKGDIPILRNRAECDFCGCF